MVAFGYLKRMTFVSFIDSSQHRFVDSEAHGGSDEGEGQVSNNTKEINVKHKNLLTQTLPFT